MRTATGAAMVVEAATVEETAAGVKGAAATVEEA
jgi:hypothetical protein